MHATTGGELFDPTPVRVDASTDLGAPSDDRVTGDAARETVERTEAQHGEVFDQTWAAACPATEFRSSCGGA